MPFSAIQFARLTAIKTPAFCKLDKRTPGLISQARHAKRLFSGR
jgi:hypothetical protein